MDDEEADRNHRSSASSPSNEVGEVASQDLVQVVQERLQEREQEIAELNWCLEKDEEEKELPPQKEEEEENARTSNLRVDLNVMMDWLNSLASDGSYGYPSIECVLDQPDSENGGLEATRHHLSIMDTVTSSTDDPMVQSIYKHCISLRGKLVFGKG